MTPTGGTVVEAAAAHAATMEAVPSVRLQRPTEFIILLPQKRV
jgi:hypothetical protein